jgi:hypothetical protein
MKEHNRRQEGRRFSGRPIWSRVLTLVGLGATLMMVCLLLGCGSDSTPASGKKAKTAKSSGAGKMDTVMPLLDNKGGASPTTFAPPSFASYPGMPSPEELEAKRKAAEEACKKVDPNKELLPGLTKRKVEASLEAERAKKIDPKREVLPGLSLESVNAKRMQARAPGPADEVLPGVTLEQLNAKAAQQRLRQEGEKALPEQIFPPK